MICTAWYKLDFSYYDCFFFVFFYLDVWCNCNLMMFYVWCKCVMSVLGTTKYSLWIVLTLGNKVVKFNISSLYWPHQSFSKISTDFLQNKLLQKQFPPPPIMPVRKTYLCTSAAKPSILASFKWEFRFFSFPFKSEYNYKYN